MKYVAGILGHFAVWLWVIIDMRRFRLFSILLLLCAIPVHGQSPTDRLQKITRDIKQFNSYQLSPMNEAEWKDLRAHGGNSQVASTDMNKKITYVRTEFINSADDKLVRRILLHEAGHIACHCASESIAEQFAEEHQ